MQPYVDRFVEVQPGGPLLVHFHGTGGDERQLEEVGRSVAPGYNLLGIRGNAMEGDARRFFRRFAEGHLDMDDFRARIVEVGDHVRSRMSELGFERASLMGYSNGANMALGLSLAYLETFAKAVLWRPMNPDLTLPTSLMGRRFLLLASLSDTITPPEGAVALEERLRSAGAAVDLHMVPGGHSLSQLDLDLTLQFLAIGNPAG